MESNTRLSIGHEHPTVMSLSLFTSHLATIKLSTTCSEALTACVVCFCFFFLMYFVVVIVTYLETWSPKLFLNLQTSEPLASVSCQLIFDPKIFLEAINFHFPFPICTLAPFLWEQGWWG